MLPKNRPQITRDAVIDLLLAQGLWRDRKLGKAVLVAIRGYYLDSMGEWGKNDRGIYDDAIILLTPTDCHAYNGNTDPSRYRSGMAQLVAPQRVRYRLGYHGYNSAHGHPAFRQDTSVIVRRDADTGHGHKLADGSFTDLGGSRFWINLHRGGYSTTSSAGCQTVPPSQWTEFYQKCVGVMDGFNQLSINYYLLNNPALETS